jgi:hypothetical protein
MLGVLGLLGLGIVNFLESYRTKPVILPTYSPGSIGTICNTFQQLGETQFCTAGGSQDAVALKFALNQVYSETNTRYDQLIPQLNHLKSDHSFFCDPSTQDLYQLPTEMNCPPPSECMTDRTHYECWFSILTSDADLSISVSINQQNGLLSNFRVALPGNS